jgi:hypothetical protein
MFSLLDSRLHELPSANWSRQDPCDSANRPQMSEEAAVPPPLRTGVVRGYLFFLGNLENKFQSKLDVPVVRDG